MHGAVPALINRIQGLVTSQRPQRLDSDKKKGRLVSRMTIGFRAKILSRSYPHEATMWHV
jgi:hypothetical protein